MNFIKKHIAIILIVILSLLLRLINLDKSGGLWYDEMSIYSIASKSFPAGMLEADAHRFLLFPLYYLTYNIWINIFGNADITIRGLSVFFDILSIIAAYFAGKTLGNFLGKDKEFNKKTGIFYSVLYAINSSFIYYAQEAKFYSMTFFLINILIIFWLKFLKKKNSKSFWCFYTANFLLIYAYTSQILLTVLIYLTTLIYFTAEKKLKENLKYMLVLLSVYAPLIIIMFKIKHYFSGNFDAVVYDNSFILEAVQNYFSPVLIGLQNNILHFQQIWLKGLFNIKFWIFVLFPVIYMLSCITLALKKIVRYILIVPVFYILFHIISSNITHYKVLVRYTLMALPFLLLAASTGIVQMKNKKFRNTLLIFYTIISLCGIFSINGALHIKRPDGYRDVTQILIDNSINPDADFVLPIRVELLEKYYQIKGEKLSLYQLNREEAQQTYLTAEEIQGIKNDKRHLHQYYKRYLLTKTPDKKFTDYIKKEFLQNNQLVIISDKTITMFTNQQLEILANSENYEKYPLQFLRLSKLNNDLLYTALQSYRLKQHLYAKNWEIFVLEK